MNGAALAPGTHVTYSSYLEIDRLLDAQRPHSRAHDEMMFIVVHQVYELWFKLLLHELAGLQQRLEAGDSGPALHTLRRCLSVLRVAVDQMDVMDTLTPAQFAGFRRCLGSASGAQSAQFRELEAVLGARDRLALEAYQEGSAERLRIEAAMERPSLLDSFLVYLSSQGYPVPAEVLRRNPALPFEATAPLREVLVQVNRDDLVAGQVAEGLLDLDQLLQEWRYRHSVMVQRMIGARRGTGGTSGAAHLRDTCVPAFPVLWEVRGA
ncbi:tryptophan 2,3-dioxygenase [Planomonospora sp. ID67723]|uniref:tryptophan 2,3-dioxygenase n=1 Tax=Planomonospora sp. ID67723 TaxID=2738134 RepID=UPI0018C4020A|nr:tryptophan 2,3-dioxygenase family protein [Planomonospora sp. ID67723]MBG0829123.1 tryptophan 2,3-dioxygenase [Planomonospora sp. ID67723]